MKATPKNIALLTEAVGAANRKQLALKKREEKFNACAQSINNYKQVEAQARKEFHDLCSINQSLDTPEECDVLSEDLSRKTGFDRATINRLMIPAQMEVDYGLSPGEVNASVLTKLRLTAKEENWREILDEALQYRGDFKKITTRDIVRIGKKYGRDTTGQAKKK
jgi:hypothetical protein